MLESGYLYSMTGTYFLVTTIEPTEANIKQLRNDTISYQNKVPLYMTCENRHAQYGSNTVTVQLNHHP